MAASLQLASDPRNSLEYVLFRVRKEIDSAGIPVPEQRGTLLLGPKRIQLSQTSVLPFPAW